VTSNLAGPNPIARRRRFGVDVSDRFGRSPPPLRWRDLGGCDCGVEAVMESSLARIESEGGGIGDFGGG